MTITIDAAGRIVLPKAIRDAAHLQPGVPLEIRFRDGRIEIEPTTARVTVEVRDGVAVATTTEPVPTLTADVVQGTTQVLRDERG